MTHHPSPSVFRRIRVHTPDTPEHHGMPRSNDGTPATIIMDDGTALPTCHERYAQQIQATPETEI
jgi:hypothetical protein